MASPIKDAKTEHIINGFTEITERGKGFLRSRKPGTNQFALTTQAGNRGWHFGAKPYTIDNEIDTVWVSSVGSWDYEVVKNDFHCFVRDSVPVSYRYYDPDTEHYIELTVNAIEWVNDENDSEAAASFGQVTPTINDDTITWEDIAIGWDVRVEAQTGRLAKWMEIDSLASLGSPTIGGTNIRLQMQFTFQKSSGLEVWVDGVQWSEQNNTWVETNSDIEFRDEVTQKPIFWFERPIGKDSDNDLALMSHRVRRIGANFYTEIDTSWSWLQSATFPISLDDTINPQVGITADDGWWSEGLSDLFTTQANDVVGDRTSLGWGNCNQFARFAISGPTSGAICGSNSYCDYYSSSGNQTITALLNAINENDPAAPTTYAEAEGDPRTTASVAWSGNFASAGWYQSGDISSIIQELWDSGYGLDTEHIVMYHEDNGTTDNYYVNWNDYTNNSSNAPKLYIEYTAAISGKVQQSKLIRSNQIPIHQLQL